MTLSEKKIYEEDRQANDLLWGESEDRKSSLYPVMFFLVFSITLTKFIGGIVGRYFLFFIPGGFRTISIALILILLTMRVYWRSNRKKEIRKLLFTVFWVWLPFLFYLAIRTELAYVGIFKFVVFMVSTAIPCFALVVMYVNDSYLFKKYFFGTLLVINVLLAVYAPIVPSPDKLYDVSIWLSRGMAISTFFIIVNLKFNKWLMVNIFIVFFFFIIMLFIGSRGPVISLLIVCMLYFLIGFRYKVLTIPLTFYLIFLVVVGLLCIEPLQNSVRSFMTHGDRERISNIGSGRLSMIAPSIKIIKENPVFGVGLNNWALAYANTRVSKKAYSRIDFKKLYKREFTAYPHNIILEVLCELGIVGFVVFTFLFFPYRQLFDYKNIYWYLFVMGLIFSLLSNDITGNPAIFLFNTLLVLTSGTSNRMLET